MPPRRAVDARVVPLARDADDEDGLARDEEGDEEQHAPRAKEDDQLAEPARGERAVEGVRRPRREAIDCAGQQRERRARRRGEGGGGGGVARRGAREPKRVVRGEGRLLARAVEPKVDKDREGEAEEDREREEPADHAVHEAQRVRARRLPDDAEEEVPVDDAGDEAVRGREEVEERDGRGEHEREQDDLRGELQPEDEPQVGVDRPQLIERVLRRRPPPLDQPVDDRVGSAHVDEQVDDEGVADEHVDDHGRRVAEPAAERVAPLLGARVVERGVHGDEDVEDLEEGELQEDGELALVRVVRALDERREGRRDDEDGDVAADDADRRAEQRGQLLEEGQLARVGGLGGGDALVLLADRAAHRGRQKGRRRRRRREGRRRRVRRRKGDHAEALRPLPPPPPPP